MASICIAIFTILLTALSSGAQQNNSGHIISLGSSLSSSNLSASWPSPSGRFEFGFYAEGNGYKVGITMVTKSGSIIVWTWNRTGPPVSLNSAVDLTKKGELLLRSERGEEFIVATEAYSASFALMLDSGNFVLYNNSGGVVWESFNYPTDTILGGQSLNPSNELFSSASQFNHSTGFFRLGMQLDGNLVLYPIVVDTRIADAYWSSGTPGNGPNISLYLNSTTGALQLFNITKLVRTITSVPSSVGDSMVSSLIYRLTLDLDGILRLYSHASNGEGEPNILWTAPSDACEVRGYCGLNSYCTFNDNQPYCNCLPGMKFFDPDRPVLGCERNYSSVCHGGKENATFYSNITVIRDMVWESDPYIKDKITVEECRRSCLEDCDCGVAQYDSGFCTRQSFPLKYMKRVSDQLSDITSFFKVGIQQQGNNSSRDNLFPEPLLIIERKKPVAAILIVALGLITMICSLAISGLYIFKIQVSIYKRQLENGNLGLHGEEMNLRLFSYAELKRATNGFKQELGKGSFGSVYKGSFYKGRKIVAVKRLEKLVEDGEMEFRAEMRTIGRTYHRNLVRLLGYCSEDSERLLVYEFMSNGSLADLLFRAARRPQWHERVRIAVDIARGLLYLHEECATPIIHCDIKPQNILMDDFWTAKISDFGLSKLLMPDQTRTFTIVRGTIGYLAPEWHKNTPISVKADIYSFGILLLEIVSCRRNMELTISKPEEIVLSSWAYNCFVERELNKLVGGEEVEKQTLEKMVKVGLWCIQDEPALRPSMKSVVLMLEGITDIASPPCPTTPSM